MPSLIFLFFVLGLYHDTGAKDLTKHYPPVGFLPSRLCDPVLQDCPPPLECALVEEPYHPEPVPLCVDLAPDCHCPPPCFFSAQGDPAFCPCVCF